MPRLPIVSGKELIKILTHFGYRIIRQRGSHIRLACMGKKSVTVPNHKMIGYGLLNKILRDADIPSELFVKMHNEK